MTRTECESQILAKLAEIREIAAEYMEREPEFLTLTILRNTLSCNNRYWAADGADNDKPIDGFKGEA